MTLARTFAIVVLLLCAAVACNRDPEALKRAHLSKGDEYAAGKKYSAAIIEYRNALQQDPRFGPARARLAEAYIQTGDGVNALRESVRAADLMPADLDMQIQATNFLVLAGRFADARDRVLPVLQHDAGNVRALVALGNALAGLKDVDGGIARIEEAIRLDPDRAGSYTNLGVLQVAAGRPAEAEAAYRKAMAAAPRSAPPRLALAQLYWVSGKPHDAETFLLEALALAPQDVVGNRFAAAFYQTNGQPEKAERYLRTAVEVEGTPIARLTLAEYYLATSRPHDAAAVLRDLTSDSTVGPVATIRLAVLDYAEGRVDQAAAALDRILAEDPRQVQAMLVKSSMLFDQRRYDEAQERVDAAVAVDPTSAQAHFARGRVLSARHRPDEARQAFNESLRLNPRAAGTQVELAKLSLSSGAPEAAVALAGAATKLDPRRLDARLVLARGLMARQDLIQAGSVLTELVSAFPTSAVVHAQLGLLRTLKKDVVGAGKAFERAIELDPLQFDAVGGLVALDLMARRPASARQRVDSLVARAPNNPEALTLAGRVYLLVGSASEAEQMLRRVLEADPGALPAYSLLGGLYVKERRLADARREFQHLADRQSRPVTALTMIGLIHQMENRIDEARKAFERAVEIDPGAPVAANNLAWIYAENGGNLDVALQLAQGAKAGLPKSAEIADTLGWIYLKKDLWSLAVEPFRQAVDIEPTNPVFQYHLGLAYARSGNKEGARRTLTAALALKHDFEGAADASRVLAGL